MNYDTHAASIGISRNVGQGNCAHTYYCGRHLGRDKIPGSDGQCGPTNGPQCSDCASYQQQHPIYRAKGTGNGSGLYYCGRRVQLAGSDGFCGPTNGPQCGHCVNYQRAHISRNVGQGNCARTYYCGRHLGRDKIPGSDGQCGPTNGPQCSDCAAYQQQHPIYRAKGTGNGAGLYYCGRRVQLAGSDGFCGPTNGPQCGHCVDYQRAHTAPPASIGIPRNVALSEPSGPSQPPQNTAQALPYSGPSYSSSSNAATPTNGEREREIRRSSSSIKRDADTSEVDDKDLCVVCFEAKKNCLLLPCAHLTMCIECANAASLTKCPMCRAEIEKRLRVYL